MNKYNHRAIFGSGIILNTHIEMKVMQPDLIYNTEAKYCEGIFYELRVPLYSFEYEGWNDFWSIVTPPGFNSINYLEGDDIFFLDLGVTKYTEIEDVSVCSLHSRYRKLLHLEGENYDYGPAYELIPIRYADEFGVLPTFRDQLVNETPFSGVRFLKPKVYPPQNVGYHADVMPEFDVLMSDSPIWKYPRKLHPDSKNTCRQCGFAPIYCESCGTLVSDKCPQCEAQSCKIPCDYPEKASFIFPGYSRWVDILWGKTWEGSDFSKLSYSGPTVITKRVLDWLLHVEAKPFCARPIKVCIDGMTAQQLEWLDRAVDPVS